MVVRIQTRATKIIPGLSDLNYDERIEECGFQDTGYKNIDRNIFSTLSKDNRTRGHKVTLVKDQCRLDIRKYSFS